MFFLRLKSRAAREESDRRCASLQDALAEYRRQEHDLAEVLVRARADARELLEEARAQARGIVERATEESERLIATARAEVTDAERKLAQLRETRHDLNASLQQSLAVLAPLLPPTPKAGPRIPPGTTRGVPSGTADQDSPIALGTIQREVAEFEVRPPPDNEFASPSQGETARPAAPERARWQAITAARVGVGATLLALGTTAMLAGPLWRVPATPQPAAARGADILLPVRSAPASQTPHATSAAPRVGHGQTERKPAFASFPSTVSGATPPKSTGMAIAIDATRPVWLRVNVDGTPAVARTLQDREHLSLRAEREVTLRAGDAGAVLVRVDGGSSEPLGRDGAVVTRRIVRGLPKPTTTTPAFAGVRARERPNAAPARRDLPPPDEREFPVLSAIAGGIALAPATIGQQQYAPATPPPAAESPTGVSVPVSTGLTPEEHEVLRAHQSYFDALRQGDRTAIRRVLATGFTATGLPSPDGPTELAVSRVSVQISGVGAVVTGTALRQAHADAGTDERLLFSELWTKTNGVWNLLSVRFVQAPSAR